VLFLIGGLPGLVGRWFHFHRSDRLSQFQVVVVLGLMALAVACHLHRSRIRHIYFPEQIEVLTRVDRADVLCHTHRISGVTAREALGFLQLPLGFEGDNAWELLRGSPTPVDMSVQQARTLLNQ
jgi:hypothetical protein